MNNQDKRKTLTVEQLRQRYNFEDIAKTKKATELIRETLNRVEVQFQRFIDIINRSLSEYPSQADGNITAWFFNGIPTISQPEFTTPEDHLGDVYYDRDSGKAYEYELVDNDYEWVEITDSLTVEVLSIEASAADTADNRRVVNIVQPTPPYTIGDVYIKDGKYYRCRASRSEGNYNSLDWIPSSEYTDEMVGADTKAELNRLETEVHEGYVSNATFETTVNSINGRVDETYSYTNTVKNALDQTDEELEEVKNTVLANQTATEYSINVINQQLINGVVKFDTGTGYTFDIEGLKINKTGSIMRLILDNNGLVVYRNNEEVLRADSDGVNAENMTVRKFYIQRPIRVEKTTAISDGTSVGLGIFWVGDN